MLNIGYHTYTWTTYAQKINKNFIIDEVLRDIKKAGFSSIECGDSLEKLGTAEDFEKLLMKNGMNLISLSCDLPKDFSDKEGFQKVRKRIDFAVKFDIKVLMACGFGGRKAFTMSTLDEVKKSAAVFDEVARYARDKGIRIGFHNHWATIVENYQDFERFLEHAKVGDACLDTGHFSVFGSDAIMFIRNYHERIVHIHLKDYRIVELFPTDTYEGWGTFTELGRGNVNLDLPGTVKALEEVRFSGWAVIELDTTDTTPFESARINREYLRDLGY